MSITATLTQASQGLLMPSESEYPFEVFTWETTAPLTTETVNALTHHAPETPVEQVELEYFFRNVAYAKEWHDDGQKANVSKFQAFMQALQNGLTDVQVYRVGAIEVDVYIVGKTPAGNFAGVSTKVIET